MFDVEYSNYLSVFNDGLNKTLSSLDGSAPELIRQAMTYAVSGGGKRIRPVLCLSTVKMLGGDIFDALDFAVAIELIHSYSLVHDDLPAMDNDDYRRGKLSTHKKFGEAYGILAGDALLNLAYEICFSKKNFCEKDLKAARIIAEYAGYNGMIAGQVLDLQNEKNPVKDEKNLYDVYKNKTAKLITAPLLVASELCGGAYFEELKKTGEHLGIMFQISDDVLDVSGDLSSIGKTPHKDELEDKLTSVKVFGLKGAAIKAKEHYEAAKSVLSTIKGSEFLSSLADKLFSRTF